MSTPEVAPEVRLAAVAQQGGLTPKERDFCFRIARGEKQFEAARGAGLGGKRKYGPSEAASRLMKQARIRDYIALLRELSVESLVTPEAAEGEASKIADLAELQALLTRMVREGGLEHHVTRDETGALIARVNPDYLVGVSELRVGRGGVVEGLKTARLDAIKLLIEAAKVGQPASAISNQNNILVLVNNPQAIAPTYQQFLMAASAVPVAQEAAAGDR